MIDTKNPCAGENNWKASVGSLGGTPGKKNSVDGLIIDQAGPQLKRAYIKDSVTIVLVFNEPVDSSQATIVNNYTIDGGLTINNVIAVSPLFEQVQLKL